MIDEKLDRYNPDYTYKKDSITIDMSSMKYPIIERTNNGLLFPLGPKNDIDMKDLKE
jgi:hypothetical protein